VFFTSKFTSKNNRVSRKISYNRNPVKSTANPKNEDFQSINTPIVLTTHPHSIFARVTRVVRQVARVEYTTPSNRNGKEEWKYCSFTRTSEGISWPKESK
jgi:hypothetical protein